MKQEDRGPDKGVLPEENETERTSGVLEHVENRHSCWFVWGLILINIEKINPM